MHFVCSEKDLGRRNRLKNQNESRQVATNMLCAARCCYYYMNVPVSTFSGFFLSFWSDSHRAIPSCRAVQITQPAIRNFPAQDHSYDCYYLELFFYSCVFHSSGENERWVGGDLRCRRKKKGEAADQTGHFGLRLDRFRDDQSDTCPPFP